ncbi:MAG TPA: TIGR03013 family XrtA/PEP-CTERM system glycosyltransferase [Alphaproteobacteria bacterium]|nr:TIGR03013 family XrtA/PEP-CTERM system glycosyltransferase [Alphaproteobacteria bacterium]
MLALLILEMAVLGGSVYYLLSTGIHSPQLLKDLRGQLGRFSFLFAAVVGIAMISMGLYSRSAMSDYRTFTVKVLIALALVVPANMVGTSLFHEELYESANASTYWWLKAPLVWLSVILLTRLLFGYANRQEFMKRRIFLLGSGTRAAAIRQMAFHGSNQAFVVAGTFDPGGFEERRTGADSYQSIAEFPAGGPDWVDVVRRAHASEIVVALDDRRALPVSQLLRCKIEGIHIIDYQTFCERETCRLDLDELRATWLIFGAGFTRGFFTDLLKRFFDIFVSAVMLLITSPFLLIAAILVKLESPGPILYRQERVGLHGRPFMVLKLRSMRQDAETNGAPQWAQVRDPRVTRVGAFIRLTRIDELPQLFTVLRGDMSFVGPRPERPYFVEQLSEAIPFYRERHCVKPGITGWAQVNYPYGASLEDSRQKLAYDLYYVKNHGLFLDFIILLSTVRVILMQQGAR